MKKKQVAQAATLPSLADQQSGERLTMQQRIDEFYRQSGGPNNPKIKQVLEHHLLYGKDHGAPGRKETVMDALTDTVVGDPMLLMLVQYLNNRRVAQSPKSADADAETVRQLQREVSQLKVEMGAMRTLLEQIADRLQPSPDVLMDRVE